MAHYSNQFSLGRALTKQCPYCSSKALHLSVHAVVLGKSDGSARGEHHSLLPSLAFSAMIVTSSYQKIFRNRKDEKADEKTTTLMASTFVCFSPRLVPIALPISVCILMSLTKGDNTNNFEQERPFACRYIYIGHHPLNPGSNVLHLRCKDST